MAGRLYIAKKAFSNGNDNWKPGQLVETSEELAKQAQEQGAELEDVTGQKPDEIAEKQGKIEKAAKEEEWLAHHSGTYKKVDEKEVEARAEKEKKEREAVAAAAAKKEAASRTAAENESAKQARTR